MATLQLSGKVVGSSPQTDGTTIITINSEDVEGGYIYLRTANKEHIDAYPIDTVVTAEITEAVPAEPAPEPAPAPAPALSVVSTTPTDDTIT